jgi:uncharacterized protein YbjT (DUF2867 family)
MRIVVFGATGSTGRQVVDQALSAGHDVTAVARHPEHADAVVSCIGPRSNLRPDAVMSVGTAHMAAAAEDAGVRRFVFQSGIGLSDGAELSRANRWLLAALWRPLFAAAIGDKAEGERLLRASALDWVIVRPVVLRNAPAAGHFLAGPRAPVALLSALSFADCAACLLRAVSEPAWTRQVVNLGRS